MNHKGICPVCHTRQELETEGLFTVIATHNSNVISSRRHTLDDIDDDDVYECAGSGQAPAIHQQEREQA